MTTAQKNRARGALLGLAVGDALGMPTQNFSRAAIAARYGILDGFLAAPADNAISHGLAAGRVTDDTDQALILGKLLVAGRGHVEPRAFADALLAWERHMIAIGSADLLGPSTRRALLLVADGVSTDLTGAAGATNGAAMRVAPVGIAFSAGRLERLVDAVVQTGHVTHNTNIAIAGAAAVAAAVSTGIDGGTVHHAFAAATAAARIGAARGHYFAGPDVAARIDWAIGLVRDVARGEALDRIDRLVGTGLATQESVPAAFAVCALAPENPWLACRLAASLGGDCDTIAAMAGAIMGACHGAEAFPPTVVQALRAANPDLGLKTLADDLLALRTGAIGAEPV